MKHFLKNITLQITVATLTRAAAHLLLVLAAYHPQVGDALLRAFRVRGVPSPGRHYHLDGR
jgi:hypothetical protein